MFLLASAENGVNNQTLFTSSRPEIFERESHLISRMTTDRGTLTEHKQQYQERTCVYNKQKYINMKCQVFIINTDLSKEAGLFLF